MVHLWERDRRIDRTPPLSQDGVRALATVAIISFGRVDWALAVLLGFHCLLSTGEVIGIQLRHFSLPSGKQQQGVLALPRTKMGIRNSIAESVTITDLRLCKFIGRFIEGGKRDAKLFSGAADFYKFFKHCCAVLGLQGFRPYGLRRGGATELWRVTGDLDATLLRGRWSSIK